MEKYHLDAADYAVIGASLLISVCIGVASRIYAGRQQTAREYMLAGKNMSKFPVIFSIIVTMTSAASLISSPVENYRYGLKYAVFLIPMPIGMFLASIVFIPVYFQCGVSTVNEFLVMRYGKMIRYILSAIFLLQMIFYMSIALYSCVLALSAVTDLSMEMSIISLGGICTLYCSLGGLKAVLWTDVFQASLMITCLLSLYIVGIRDAGGVSNIYERAKEGRRLELFDLQFDFTRRYGFWACFCRGLLYGFGCYGTNQVEVQRTLSLSTVKRAKSTLRMSSIPVLLMYLLCSLFGIVLYAVYYDCDPVLNKSQTGLSKYDQLVPAYIVRKFSSIPGMTGLCMAGIFSASLSTISSALNSCSTVTIVDFIKPIFVKYNISDLNTVKMARALSLVYGGICIGLSFCFLDVRSLKKLSLVLVTLPEGPVTAVFLAGVLSRKASDKCVSVAVVLSYITMACLSFGSLLSRYNEAPLPLSISNCPTQNITAGLNILALGLKGDECPSVPSTRSPEEETFILFKISFMWHSTFGFILTLIFIFIAVLVRGWKKNAIPANSKCLSPVTRLWMKTPDQPDSEFVQDKYEQKECVLQLSLRA